MIREFIEAMMKKRPLANFAGIVYDFTFEPDSASRSIITRIDKTTNSLALPHFKSPCRVQAKIDWISGADICAFPLYD